MALSGLDGLLDHGPRNALVAWILVALLAATSIGVVVVAGALWSLFAFVLLVLAVIPPLAYRSPYIMLPWEVLVMAALPVIGLALGTDQLSSQFAAYIAVAAIALVLAVELEMFTSIRLSPGFAVLLVVVATLSAAAMWGVAQWGFDVYLGTDYIKGNEELMHEWIYSTLAGLAAGGVFMVYFRRHDRLQPRTGPAAPPVGTPDAKGGSTPTARTHSRLGAWLPARRQRQLSRLMVLSLVGLLFIGLERGSVGIIVNTGVALGVTQIPAVLERDYELPMDPRITLWITSAAFLHALGTVGIPSAGWNFYSGLGWWDHLTHALSASVVAAAGYATVRAIDTHSDEVYLPPKFIAVIILLFVLAFGVLWELLEYAIGLVAAAFGMPSVLTQYGADDTLWDLIYNTIGGVLVALWGGVYLTDLSTAIADRWAAR